ncbi:hypothetical protein CRYUN_Cryun22dG0111500 [Craigia yunnanensis]
MIFPEEDEGKSLTTLGDVAAKQQPQQHSIRATELMVQILELGSGTGLVGIAAAVTLGANVTVTDLPHVIPNLQFNVNANADVVAQKGGTVNVAPLRWGEDDDMEVIGREFDLVLASDVVHHDHLFEPLIQTLRFLLKGGVKRKLSL